MKLNIYSQSGELKATVSPSDTSTHNKVVMQNNVVNLSFVSYEFIKLEINDYIYFEGERFTLQNRCRPTKKSTVEYEYNCQFYGIENVLKNAVVMRMTDGDTETKFSYTASPREQLQLLVDNINRIQGTKNWTLGEIVDGPNIVMDFDGTKCFDALTKLAELCKTEWWIEGPTINLSRCEFGEPVELGYNKGLTGDLSKDDNEKAKFFTRLIPIGSARNIVKEDYGYSRLQLPGGVKYIDQNIQYGIIEETEEAAFSDIYPRRIGKVGTVRAVPKKIEGEDRIVYYFSDPGLNFDPNEYEIAGLVKNIVFQSGELNGRDFEVNFNFETKEFEIINQYPEATGQLPGGTLIPKTGDEYIVYNIRMPREFYPLAEEEYAKAVAEFLNEYSKDVAIYKGNTDYIDLDKRGIKLKIGQRVTLYSEVHFDEGFRASRITAINRKLNNPNDALIDCSWAVYKGRIDTIENNVVDIQTAFREQLNKDAFQILKSWDSGDPTEYNVLSAVRTLRAISNSLKNLKEDSDKKYLRKDIEDAANELITFLSGIAVEGVAKLDQVSVSNEAIFKKIVSSEKFVSGFPAGIGWGILLKEILNVTGTPQQKAVMELDEIVIRGALRVYEMIISQLSGENGTRLTSDLMRVASIDPAEKKIYLDTEKGVLYNPFRAGDVLKVQHYKPGSNEVVKTYEFIVDQTGIGAAADGENRLDWITYQSFTGSEGDVAARDVLVRIDSILDSDRKGVIKHTASEPGAPYIDVVYGMRTDPDNAVRSRLGRLAGIITAWWGQLKGYGLYSDNAYLLGDFRLRTGEDVRIKFEILEGMFQSAIQSTTYNLTEKDNFLKNATFTDDAKYWERERDIDLYNVGGVLLDIGTNFLSEKHKIADIVQYDGRRVLRLKKSYIRQANGYIRKPEPGSVLYLSFRYACIKTGTLEAGFSVGNDAEGAFPYTTKEIQAGGGQFEEMEISGVWNGEGDFILKFSGDIYIDRLILTNHPLEDYRREVSTLFEQTAEQIKAVAKEVSAMDKTIKEAGWITTADGNKLWATITDVDALGNEFQSHAGSFHVTAEQIAAMVSRIDDVDDGLDLIEQVVNNAGWITTADGNKLWATREEFDGIGEKIREFQTTIEQTAKEISLKVSKDKIVAEINASADGVKIKGNKIQLEGTVTANGNFKINTDGTIEAQGGTFSGHLRFPFVPLGISDAVKVNGGYLLKDNLNIAAGDIEQCIDGEGGYHDTVILPYDPRYNGTLVTILNTCFPPYTRVPQSFRKTLIKTESGDGIYGTDNPLQYTNIYAKTSLSIIGGLLQFMGVPYKHYSLGQITRWVVLNYRET